MSEMPEVVEKPVVREERKVKPKIQEEKQVIVHCSIPCIPGTGLRIWKTTYLVTEEGVKIPLLFWENISLAPDWTPVMENCVYRFTLIFAGLPSSCRVFSMVEEIPEPGGFHVPDIRRNKTDVYSVSI